MFFIKEEEHTLSLHPTYFGPNTKNYLREQLVRDVEGKHNGEYYVHCIMDNIDFTEGKVMPGTGRAEYKIHYKAIVWKPFRGEVVDGIASGVIETGIFVDVGPLRVFISKAQIPADFQFDPHATPPQWVNSDSGLFIEKGTRLRIKLQGVRSELGGDMYGIATIKEDYLGPLESEGNLG